VDAFESAACDFYGARFALAVNSGTGALMTAMSAVGVGSDCEVIVPALNIVHRLHDDARSTGPNLRTRSPILLMRSKSAAGGVVSETPRIRWSPRPSCVKNSSR